MMILPIVHPSLSLYILCSWLGNPKQSAFFSVFYSFSVFYVSAFTFNCVYVLQLGLGIPKAPIPALSQWGGLLLRVLQEGGLLLCVLQ